MATPKLLLPLSSCGRGAASIELSEIPSPREAVGTVAANNASGEVGGDREQKAPLTRPRDFRREGTLSRRGRGKNSATAFTPADCRAYPPAVRRSCRAAWRAPGGVLKHSIALTRPLRGRPLPIGER